MKVDRAELTETLEDAGLSPYQADAYVTVLELGSAPVTRIADASGVPDPRIYDVLRDLESAGYIETYEQESLYARANSLDEITDDLRTRANRFTEATEEIERRWNEPSVEQSTVSIVTRFETVIKNADEFIRAAAAFTLGDVKAGLVRMAQALKPDDVAKWTVVTYLPFLWRPEEHMFLKPEVTKDYADRVGHPFLHEYTPELTEATYRSLLDLVRETREQITDLEPADSIDIQSFIWVVGRYPDRSDKFTWEAGDLHWVSDEKSGDRQAPDEQD
jgi:DNA-binding PadR family transcriptional regulator